jgi:hypothetical protein
MNRKIFLTLVSLIAASVGTVALAVPGVLLLSKGVLDNPAANVWVREVGAALISMAYIAFLVRGHPDSPTMKAFLMGNAIFQLGLLPIELVAFANGTLTKGSGVVPNSLLHVGLASAFIYFATQIKTPKNSHSTHLSKFSNTE